MDPGRAMRMTTRTGRRPLQRREFGTPTTLQELARPCIFLRALIVIPTILHQYVLSRRLDKTRTGLNRRTSIRFGLHVGAHKELAGEIDGTDRSMVTVLPSCTKCHGLVSVLWNSRRGELDVSCISEVTPYSASCRSYIGTECAPFQSSFTSSAIDGLQNGYLMRSSSWPLFQHFYALSNISAPFPCRYMHPFGLFATV
ncbi:hypothetical protein BDN72DRAFT_186834 [Pluteus cervinus]|uniref:Uncharacterized protein n=1 Tax=Pluteus cervinus TaxID=181527 RepID=A0ACD3B6T9_9AGAR|nr:hypothetical protein BDN72DRAFT_186834 [Pluteus cervinus]